MLFAAALLALLSTAAGVQELLEGRQPDLFAELLELLGGVDPDAVANAAGECRPVRPAADLPCECARIKALSSSENNFVSSAADAAVKRMIDT